MQKVSGFSVEWLDLREAADHRARDRRLLESVIGWLNSLEKKDRIVADLGSGTGSTIRGLQSSKLQLSSVHWRLIDNDPEVLAEAIRRHSAEQIIESFLIDLSDTGKLPLERVRLVTTSALLDLVSANFVRELSQLIKQKNEYRPLGLYSALNYDGTIAWKPCHPLDALMLENFNNDQLTDKGFGPALGPDAAGFLQNQFHTADFHCFAANSPWFLGSADHLLTASLIDGLSETALRSVDLAHEKITEWKEFRLKNTIGGTCSVGHIDVLVLPRDTFYRNEN